MRMLVTAGNTRVMIDRVRAVTNIFTGRTGARIALRARGRGHTVTLLTSHPDTVPELLAGRPAPVAGWTVLPYHTFEDLDALMAREVADGEYDAVVHSAAVSDYRVAGTFAPADGTHFDAERGLWAGSPPALADRSAGKVKSDEPELWLRLVRTPKLVDRIRTDWGFAGVLVKFKLEVGVTEDRLLEVAERSRQASRADWMVANTLDGAAEWAYLGPFAGGRYERLPRADLDDRLLDCIELSVKRI